MKRRTDSGFDDDNVAEPDRTTIMSILPLILLALAGYFVPLGIGLAIALWRFKRRLPRDMAISCLVAIGLWLAWTCTFQNKSLSNFVIEPVLLAGVILVVEVIRLALEKRGVLKTGTLGVLNVVVSAGSAFGILLAVPWIPE